MTLTFERDLDSVKLNQLVKYLYRSKVFLDSQTDTHTGRTDRSPWATLQTSYGATVATEPHSLVDNEIWWQPLKLCQYLPHSGWDIKENRCGKAAIFEFKMAATRGLILLCPHRKIIAWVNIKTMQIWCFSEKNERLFDLSNRLKRVKSCVVLTEELRIAREATKCRQHQQPVKRLPVP